jgi:Skp family chaperone for outer membrane proteins
MDGRNMRPLLPIGRFGRFLFERMVACWISLWTRFSKGAKPTPIARLGPIVMFREAKTMSKIMCGLKTSKRWKFFAPLFGFSLLAPLSTGCNQQPAGGAVAVVDLDQVAELTGVTAEIKTKLAAKEQTLNGELLTAQAKLRQELANRKTAAGELPSREEAQKLQQFEASANRALASARNTAKTLLDQERLKLVAQFREQIKPVMAEIAKEKGYSVIIPKNDGLLLAISPGVEITEAVSAKIGRGTIHLGTTDVAAKTEAAARSMAPALPAEHEAATPANTTPAPELPNE